MCNYVVCTYVLYDFHVLIGEKWKKWACTTHEVVILYRFMFLGPLFSNGEKVLSKINSCNNGDNHCRVGDPGRNDVKKAEALAPRKSFVFTSDNSLYFVGPLVFLFAPE